MKYIVVPAPTHTKEDPSKAVTMHSFLMDVVCALPEIGKGIEGIRRVQKLNDLFSGEDNVVGVEDADYKAVMAVMQTIPWTSPARVMHLLPFMEAWDQAEKHDETWKNNRKQLKAVKEGLES